MKVSIENNDPACVKIKNMLRGQAFFNERFEKIVFIKTSDEMLLAFADGYPPLVRLIEHWFTEEDCGTPLNILSVVATRRMAR